MIRCTIFSVILFYYLFDSQRLSLEEQAVVSLWYHNLSSLEEAVLSLLESVLANKKSTPQNLEQQIAESLLVGITLKDKKHMQKIT